VFEEVLDRAIEHETAPHERGLLVVDEMAHRYDLEQPTRTGHARSDALLVRDDLLRAGVTREAAFDTEHPRDGVAPDVGVEYAHGEPPRREAGREVDGDGRLADAAFARGHHDDLGGWRHFGVGCAGGLVPPGFGHGRGLLVLAELGPLEVDRRDRR